MAAEKPRVMSFVPFAGTDGQIDHGRLEAAVSAGFRIIRWHLDSA
jgi:hypothetical protein